MISIIIPAYNSSATIVAALDSVLAQTVWGMGRETLNVRCEKWGDVQVEVIVVDDCSTDNTVEVVRDWIAQHLPTNTSHLLRLTFHALPENGGPAKARNKGIQEAQGDWIAFLDADDLWLPCHLEVLMTAARETGAIMVCGESVRFQDGEKSISREAAKFTKEEGDLPRRRGEVERENQMLREFKLRSTASEIPATLSGEIPDERGDVQQSKPLLPLFPGSRKRCGNFGHGTPWAKYPQHCLYRLLSSLCLRASAVKSSPLRSSMAAGVPQAAVQTPDLHLTSHVSRLISLEELARHNPIATSTVLVQKQALEAVGGFDPQFRGPEDYDLWIRVAAYGQKKEKRISREAAKDAKKEKILPRRHGGAERENQILRAFKLRSTASEIPATLSGDIHQSKPFLPLFPDSKNRCGNFGHGTPWAKYPQCWLSHLLSLFYLRASVVKSFFSCSSRLRVKNTFGCIVHVSEPVSLYRQVTGSLSMDERKFLPQVLRVIEKAYGAGGALAGLPEWKNAALATQYQQASWMAFGRGDRLGALKYLFEGCWYNILGPKRIKKAWAKLIYRYCFGKVPV